MAAALRVADAAEMIPTTRCVPPPHESRRILDHE